MKQTLYLFQYKNGYRYNSDSLVLYDFISTFKPKGKILDVGSGSGILGLLLKRDFPNISLTQIDIQSSNIELTCKSAKKNNLDSKVLHADVRECRFSKKFDFIVTNPPFYHKGSQKSKNEDLKVSRYADMLPFNELCIAVSQNLKPRGSFIFCYDAEQIDCLLNILIKNRFKVNYMRFVHTKENKKASIVLIHAKKSSKSLCKILPPIYMNSNEVEYIYKNTKTESLLCLS
ncbi:MAG: methyltransferase [Sulfurospirillum sp.]|nr:methyltransferase [Sulfurospirillum sp.]MBL0702950.1 methyltransferase [Sulfurospirillum sp.]